MSDTKNIQINLTNTESRNEYPWMAEILVNGEWVKEMGPFPDPQFALQEISKSEDLSEYMRPKHPHP